MKKRILGLAVMLLCAMFLTEPVSAQTQPYGFTFSSTEGYLPVASGYKDDTEQNYYLTINGGNISSTNIFGTRIRRASDDALVSQYKCHYSYEQGKSYAYATTVYLNTLYYMRGKKDSDSTSSAPLVVSGKVTY